jgi:hypothetical protein
MCFCANNILRLCIQTALFVTSAAQIFVMAVRYPKLHFELLEGLRLICRLALADCLV